MPRVLTCGYDNFDDAKVKLSNTYCMYKGKAIHIKGVYPVDNELTKFQVEATYLQTGRATGMISIDDPDFDCAHYNIGYINRTTAAAWWYRIPHKQWQQGLKPQQCKYEVSRREFSDPGMFNGKPLAAMLENSYPAFQSAVLLIKNQEAHIVAFHRNFAVTRDTVHADFLIEYKGDTIGYTHNGEDFKLMPEHQHLNEALKEAVG